jgi:metal-responsive CopG/Arc/MetJ family transcriptional regulator
VTKLVSFRIEEGLIDSLDRAREVDGRGRSEVVREALQLWLRQRELADRIRRHEEGYVERPVAEAEFTPVLGAQQWPK